MQSVYPLMMVDNQGYPFHRGLCPLSAAKLDLERKICGIASVFGLLLCSSSLPVQSYSLTKVELKTCMRQGTY